MSNQGEIKVMDSTLSPLRRVGKAMVLIYT
jgi:hypothetical protein